MIGEEYSTTAEASWSLRMALWLRGGLSVFYNCVEIRDGRERRMCFGRAEGGVDE